MVPAAWQQHASGPLGDTPWRRKALLVAAATAIYLAGIGVHWRVFPDSANYLLLADSLSQGTGYAIHGHPQGKFPPGFAAYLALMQQLGLGSMVWLNALMTAMALAALWCGYGLLREVATRRLAVTVMLVVALSYEMYQLSGAQLSDIPFMLLVSAGLWSLTRTLRRGRGWLEFGSLALIASCWIRILGVPLALGAAMGLAMSLFTGDHRVGRRRIALNVVAIVAGVALTCLWLWQRDRAVQAASSATSYATELSVLSAGNLVEWLWQPLRNGYHGGRSLARLLTGQYLPPSLALVLFWLPISVGAYLSGRRRQFVLLAALGGYLGCILMLRAPLARYLLPIAPGLILFLVIGLRRLGLHVARRPVVRTALSVGMVLLLILNLPKDCRLIYRTHHPRSLQLQTDSSVTAAAGCLQQLARRDCAGLRSSATLPLPRTGTTLMGGELARGGSLVSDKQAAILSYISGVPHLPIGNEMAWRPPPAAQLRACFDAAGVGYIALWPAATRPTRFGKALRQAVQCWPDCQLVFARPDVQIFAFGQRTTAPKLLPLSPRRVATAPESLTQGQTIQ